MSELYYFKFNIYSFQSGMIILYQKSHKFGYNIECITSCQWNIFNGILFCNLFYYTIDSRIVFTFIDLVQLFDAVLIYIRNCNIIIIVI